MCLLFYLYRKMSPHLQQQFYSVLELENICPMEYLKLIVLEKFYV